MEVRLGAGVTDCDGAGVTIGAERIETRTIIWAAGVMASPAAEWLGVEADRAGRVKVARRPFGPRPSGHLRHRRRALAIGEDGKPLPGVAPVAKQQGNYVASC